MFLNKIKNGIIKNAPIIIISIIFLASLGFLIFGIISSVNAKSAGESIGNAIGTFAGAANGSFNGTQDGKKAGKEAGLSAKDTEVNIDGKLVNINKLQVLVAGIKEHHVFSIGDDYKALFIKNGTAVFTVDFSKMIVEKANNNSIKIILPMPEVTTYFDESETEMIAEYQKANWSGNANDGSTAKVNSDKEITRKMQEAVSADSDLMKQAMDSAVKQVKTIAESVNINGDIINVEFREENS